MQTFNYGPPAPDPKREFLFLENLSLFLENSEMILKNERFRNAIITHGFCTFMYAPLAKGTLTLGKALQLWLNHPEYSRPCRCGKKQYLIEYGGSPLSGGGLMSYLCPYCGKAPTKKNAVSIGKLTKIYNQYEISDNLSDSIELLEELVVLLNGKTLETVGTKKTSFFQNFNFFNLWKKR